MKYNKIAIVLLLLTLLIAGCNKEISKNNNSNNLEIKDTKVEKTVDSDNEKNNNNDTDNKVDSINQDLDKKAEDIVSNMTLEEKVAQMIIARCPSSSAKELAEQYQLGGYILFARDFENKSKEQIINEISSYQENMKIKMFIGTDEEGGIVNRVSSQPALRNEPFKSPQNLYNSGGMDLIYNDTVEKSQFLKSFGINLNFAPVADVSTNSSDYMYPRTLGKGAEEVSAYVDIVVKAMNEQKIGSILKHFPGYGNNLDTHIGSAYDSRSIENFEENDFKPFEAGIISGVDSILVSHNIIEHIDSDNPASLSPEIHRVLREYMNFDGVIVTDDIDMEAINLYADSIEKAVLAVEAGNDLICTADFTSQIPAIVSAVNENRIDISQIDKSVKRIIKMKLKLDII